MKIKESTFSFLTAIGAVILIAVYITCVLGCKTEITKLEKPFIIISKEHTTMDEWSFTEGYSRYDYQDKNGNIRSFQDKSDKFSIGDTLK